MSELEEMQAWFADVLRRRTALPADRAVRARAERYVQGNDRLSPAEQLEIYREQFWLRHTASLLEDFPGLSGVIGRPAWENLVEGYLAESTLTSWSLRDLGSRLPEYVEKSDWLPHHELSTDMARFDWAHIVVFDAPDPPPLDAKKLARISSWETAKVLLAPALALLHVRYPVAELRRTLAEREGEFQVPERAPSYLALHRGADRTLRTFKLEHIAFELLALLRAGHPLVSACELARERAPEDAAEFEANVGEWFRTFGARGWVIDVQPS